MILTHGANSISRGGGGAVIGGRTYRTVVMPDGKEWLAENLDYKWAGLTVDASGISDSEPRASYYNNDEAAYGIDGTYKCGLLYNYQAVKYLNDNKSTLCPGWHVPSSTEWNALLTACGGAGQAAGFKLAATTHSIASNFPNWSGATDDYGFCLVPGGNHYTQFRNFNYNGTFATSTPNGSSYAETLLIDYDCSVSINVWYGPDQENLVRLVKD